LRRWARWLRSSFLRDVRQLSAIKVSAAAR
jgi:hypothetical protein